MVDKPRNSPDGDYLQEAELLRVLGHPVRLKLLVLLAEQPANVKSLWTRLELNQSAVSQHLAKLKSRGVVKGVRSGSAVVYSINHALAARLAKWIGSRRRG